VTSALFIKTTNLDPELEAFFAVHRPTWTRAVGDGRDGAVLLCALFLLRR
jgi:hypothetical protein